MSANLSRLPPHGMLHLRMSVPWRLALNSAGRPIEYALMTAFNQGSLQRRRAARRGTARHGAVRRYVIAPVSSAPRSANETLLACRLILNLHLNAVHGGCSIRWH